MSARDDALRRNAEAGGVNFAPPRPAPPEPRPNLALGRGDVFRPSRARRLEVVVSIEWRGESWAVTTLHFAARGVAGRISSAEPVVRFLPTNGVWKKLGRWDGPLFPGAPGQLIPSDGPATVQGSDSPTDQKEATVATVVRKGKGAKGATKATAAKATPAAAEQPKANGRAARRSAEELEALVPEFVEHLSGGGKMRELKLKHGFSDDGPIRRALYFAGYDSKGAEHGDEADSIDATKAAGKKQLVKLRNEQGAAWYQLAYLSGLGEAEVKRIVTEAGGAEGRVYVASEKPAKATKATKAEDVEASEAAATEARKGTGKRVTRRATKANPSKQG